MSQSTQDLNGRVAIVTGAGGVGGIGECTARLLAEAGARVVLADLPGSKLEETAASLIKEGYDATHCATDISDERSVESLIRFTQQKLGRLDILDNNAASQGRCLVP